MPFGEHMGAFLQGIHLGAELGHTGTACTSGVLLRFNRFSQMIFQSHWTHQNSHFQHEGFLDLL